MELQSLISYAKQDSLALYNALKAAQSIYIDKYRVDICSVVSLPSLAMKIFRLNYLKVVIPILKGRNRYFC